MAKSVFKFRVHSYDLAQFSMYVETRLHLATLKDKKQRRRRIVKNKKRKRGARNEQSQHLKPQAQLSILQRKKEENVMYRCIMLSYKNSCDGVLKLKELSRIRDHLTFV